MTKRDVICSNPYFCNSHLISGWLHRWKESFLYSANCSNVSAGQETSISPEILLKRQIIWCTKTCYITICALTVYCFLSSFFFLAQGLKLRTFCLPGRHYATEPFPWPLSSFLTDTWYWTHLWCTLCYFNTWLYYTTVK